MRSFISLFVVSTVVLTSCSSSTPASDGLPEPEASEVETEAEPALDEIEPVSTDPDESTDSAPISSDDSGDTTTPQASEAERAAQIDPLFDPDAIPESEIESSTPVPTLFSVGTFIERGVEQGVWDEAAGIATMLRVLSGEIPDTSIPQLGDMHHDVGHVSERARQLIEDPATDADTVSELTALLDATFPSAAILEANSTPDGPDEVGPESPAAPQGFAAPRQSSDCTALNADVLPNAKPDGICFKLRKYRSENWPVGGHSIRVFYVEGLHPDIPGAVIDAAVNTFDSLGVPSQQIDIVMTPTTTEDYGEATEIGGRCTVTVFGAGPVADPNPPTEALKQLVAHEAVHCAQFVQFPQEAPAYITEGGAEYLSHWLYPLGMLERASIASYDRASLSTAIPDFVGDNGYDVWVFWQWMANQSSPQAVWALHIALAGGQSLASVPGINESFHFFVTAWATDGFPDSGGGTLPGFEPAMGKATTVDASAEYTFSTSAFVAKRSKVTFVADGKFDLTLSPLQNAIFTFAGNAVPASVSTVCLGDQIETAIFTTTTDPETLTMGVKYTDQRQEGGEPVDCSCPAGTWTTSFGDFVVALFSQVGQVGPPGVEVTGSGSWNLQFRQDGTATFWTLDSKIITSFAGFETVLSNMNISTAQWERNGDSLVFTNDRVVEGRAIVDGPVGGGAAITQDGVTSIFALGVDLGDGSSGDGAGGSFVVECQGDTMFVAGEGQGIDYTFVYEKVDDVEPPAALPAE